MSMLEYNDHEHTYEGEWLRVDADTFADAMEELVQGGMDEQAAMHLLLDESEWSADLDGVELVLTAALAIAEAEWIVRRRTR